MYFTMYQRYLDISKYHFELMNKLIDTYIVDYTKGGISFDLLQLDSEQQVEALNLPPKIHDESLICITFMALSLEAYLNFIGVNILGEQEYQKSYEKLRHDKKLNTLVEIKTGKGFPKSDHHWERFNKIFKKRDEIVHSKSKQVIYNEATSKGYDPHNDMEICIVFAKENVHYISEFIDFTNKLIGEDYFKRFIMDIESELTKNILEMF